MSNEPILKVENISKSFGEKNVLKNLSLEVYENDIFGIIGMSGAGKTTLLHTIIGYYFPEEGDILFQTSNNGKNQFKSIFKHHKEIKMFTGFAPQTPSFYPKLTAYENLNHYGALYGLSKEKRKNNIKHLLELTDLEEATNRQMQFMSGGMQKRLGIACALVHNPKLLILDEPTADLDPILRNQIWDLIKKIVSEGTTVMIASHFLVEIENYCTKINVLYDKQIKEIGAIVELKEHYKDKETIIIEINPGNYDAVIDELKKHVLPIESIVKRSNCLTIVTEESEEVLHTLFHALEITKEKLVKIDIKRQDLNDLFKFLNKKISEHKRA
ncbi:MAG: ABC transporter ATP-binding protein [Elusimicrobia bacterium]|nr:ABC transporter ATP-binding protein [Elusimicrobiota bacterium]